MEEKRIDPREEMENLVEALEVLLPSRNLISQLVMLLPLEHHRVRDMYPELVEDPDYWSLLCNALGLSRIERKGEVVYEPSYGSFSSKLRTIIDSLFELIRDNTKRALLSSAVGRIVLNYEREWLDSRLEALLREENISKPVKKILRVLCEEDSALPEEIKKKTELSDAELERALYVLKEFKLIEKTYDRKLKLESRVAYYKHRIIEVIMSE
ncbi:MAG TPA: hypothetical protein ENF55_01950 [Thermoprotei archaeon]|nr:hypothetical protein [Thermoprotei archaeon]